MLLVNMIIYEIYDSTLRKIYGNQDFCKNDLKT